MKKQPDQPGLFDSGHDGDRPPLLPEGFNYQAEVISAAEEAQLVQEVQRLPLQDFEFHRYIGKRRVVSFGWRYDFDERELRRADEIPPFLLPLRQRAATFAGLASADFQHVLVTEYSPGAAIGWHRDKAEFAEVVGISLVSPCRLRFRRKAAAAAWQRAAIVAEPRSAYLLAGPARTQWEHSIPPVDSLRYSITFRKMERR